MGEESREHYTCARTTGLQQSQAEAARSTRRWIKTRRRRKGKPGRARTITCSARNQGTLDLAGDDEGRRRPLARVYQPPLPSEHRPF